MRLSPLGAIDRHQLLELLYLPFRASDEKPSLVRISRAHISGVSYLNIGEAGVQLLKDLSEGGMKVKVRTTLNPGFVELSREGEKSCDPATFKKQNEIASCFMKIGVLPTFSCTPYLEGNVPERGEHLAWAESSAVLYSNSVIGAWTNKESGLGALAAALIGYTSRTGVHVPSGRIPRLLIEYDGRVNDEVIAGALGYVAGRISGDSIPAIESEGLLERERTIEFLAAFGTSGGSSMSVIEGVSPRVGRQLAEKPVRVNVGERDVAAVLEEFQTDSPPQAILVGCPHAVYISKREILSLTKRMSRLPVFVFVSRRARVKLANSGLLAKLGRHGISVIADACVMWCGLRALGYDSVVTNSVKGAYYLKNQMHIQAGLKPLKELAGGPT